MASIISISGWGVIKCLKVSLHRHEMVIEPLAGWRDDGMLSIELRGFLLSSTFNLDIKQLDWFGGSVG